MRKIRSGKTQQHGNENSLSNLRRKTQNSRKKIWTLGAWIKHWYSTYKEIVRP